MNECMYFLCDWSTWGVWYSGIQWIGICIRSYYWKYGFYDGSSLWYIWYYCYGYRLYYEDFSNGVSLDSLVNNGGYYYFVRSDIRFLYVCQYTRVSNWQVYIDHVRKVWIGCYILWYYLLCPVVSESLGMFVCCSEWLLFEQRLALRRLRSDDIRW